MLVDTIRERSRSEVDAANSLVTGLKNDLVVIAEKHAGAEQRVWFLLCAALFDSEYLRIMPPFTTHSPTTAHFLAALFDSECRPTDCISHCRIFLLLINHSIQIDFYMLTFTFLIVFAGECL